MTMTIAVRRWRVPLAGLAAGLALTFFVSTPGGQQAAAQFLAQFRSQSFAPIAIEANQGRTWLGELERLGTVKGGPPSLSATEEVASLQEAGQRVGFSLKQPDPAQLPSNLNRTPRIRVADAREARFTFDRAKARAYFDSIGRRDVALPDGFDGASLVLSIPAGALLQYNGPDNSIGVLVGQSRELTATAEGKVSLDELRDFLLGLPGLPDETTKQLRGIRDWKTTLPIPVPSSRVTWQQASVGGSEALLLNENSGLGSAVIWQRDGRVYGVAGPLKADAIERIASSLR